ncbi:MAG: tetratricopeptide repeat protein [candidate division Zixibacteria bacterium]|nr:tetratricopeptide repeat protein [candidate division Zixibacteria bacterium]
MRLASILFICILMLPVSSASGSDQDIWEQANNAYDQNNFKEALDGYLLLLEHGNRSPSVYYNLGSAYFKNNQVGMAIAAYRLCLKLDPSFTKAQENLEYVRRYTVDKVEKPPKGFLLNLWSGMAGIFSAEEYFVFTIIIYWILSLIITLMILGIGKKEFLSYLLILLVVVFILSGVQTHFVINETINTKWGVLTAASAELREGPGEDFEKIFTGHEGLEFKILSQRQGYYLVELANGLNGWIKGATLTEI